MHMSERRSNYHHLASRGIDLSGLNDDFIQSLARDLNLEKSAHKILGMEKKIPIIEELTPVEKRNLVQKFIERHPEAENEVSHLILNRLGINKFSKRYNSCRSYHIVEREDTDIDIIPNLSPVSWLSEESWVSMTSDERAGFMNHIITGGSIHSRYFPTAELFRIRSDAMTFGKNGVDRVILGHGNRRVLVLVGIHGNEPCGVEAVKMMLTRKSIFTASHSDVTSDELHLDENWSPLESLFDSLTMEFMVGNPAALEKVSLSGSFYCE